MPRPQAELNIPDDSKMTSELALAIVLRERRTELGLSQEDLADDSLNQSHVSMLESGKREIGLSRFIILARRLQMDPTELLRAVLVKMEG